MPGPDFHDCYSSVPQRDSANNYSWRPRVPVPQDPKQGQIQVPGPRKIYPQTASKPRSHIDHPRVMARRGNYYCLHAARIELARREVKCGRELPTCANCKRQGLECEQRSKYKWKDITHRTRRSISSVTSERNSIWDSNYVPSRNGHAQGESLTALKRAAALERPGMYFVDANSENYAQLYGNEAASEAVSRVGTPPTVPPPRSVIIERFKDYGYPKPRASQSQGSHSVLKSMFSKTVTRPSEYSYASTGPSLAGKMAVYALTPNAPTNMFDRALVRS